MPWGRIDAYARGIPMAPAEAHPETAQMMIMNPCRAVRIAGLFSTHPPTEESVARLRGHGSR
jgi:heat shock protein HtpX